MFSCNWIPAQMRNPRQAAWIGFISFLGITGLNSTAHAENEWLFAPYLRADLGYSITLDDDETFFDSAENDSLDMDPDSGARYQIGVGMKLNDFLRTDVTISYRDNLTEVGAYFDADGIPNKVSNELDSDAFQTSNWSTMVNIYVDPLRAAGLDTGAFSPYLQGGIGWARNTTEDLKFSNAGTIFGDTHNDFAWQIGAGVTYDITEHWKLDLSYRFIDMGEARASNRYVDGGAPVRLGNIDFDLQAHEVLIGLQYQF